jgi:hypothetical protein
VTLWIHPNVGAEEPLGANPPPAVTCVARLFGLLFPDGSRRTDQPDAPTRRSPALGFDPSKPAFRWLAAESGLRAWLSDEGAARAALARGVPLLGPDPQVVRRVHDKAFAQQVCRTEGYEPRSLQGLISVFEPEELADADHAVATLRRRVGEWPAWTEGRFCLKPRLGGSGRGRVAGRRDTDPGELRRALPRLARQGGALLEPWLARERDLSVQLHVADDGTLTLLASLEQQVSASGVYRGHRGRLDHRLRIASPRPDDGAVFEPACAVARAAHAEGFRGPCSVDAFSFHGERGIELRPVVELNARFTTGTIVAGLLRLCRKQIQKRVPAQPGETRLLEFALAPAKRGAAETNDVFRLRLGEDPGGFAPALVVRRAAEPPPET